MKSEFKGSFFRPVGPLTHTANLFKAEALLFCKNWLVSFPFDLDINIYFVLMIKLILYSFLGLTLLRRWEENRYYFLPAHSYLRAAKWAVWTSLPLHWWKIYGGSWGTRECNSLKAKGWGVPVCYWTSGAAMWSKNERHFHGRCSLLKGICFILFLSSTLLFTTVHL